MTEGEGPKERQQGGGGFGVLGWWTWSCAGLVSFLTPCLASVEADPEVRLTQCVGVPYSNIAKQELGRRDDPPQIRLDYASAA